MAALATSLRPGNQHNEVAGGTLASGHVLVTAEGNVAVRQGLKPEFVGDEVRYLNDGVFNFTNNSIAWLKGQTAYWDPVNQVLATSGAIRIGRVVAATGSGVAVVPIRLMRDAREVHWASIVASAAITATASATKFDQQFTIPANYLQAGDIIKVRGQVIATATNSTDTLTLALLIGSTVVITTAAVDVANNDVGFLDATIVVRSIGVSGTIVAAGLQTLGPEASATAKPDILASTAIDTTAAQTLAVQATWSSNNVGNSCRMDIMEVQILRA